MAKASDNVFPKLIFSSGSAPATPSAGQGKVYEKSSDKKLYFKNEDGTEYDLTASGGSLTVQDENTNVSTAVTQIDFQGAGVTATSGSGEVVVTIPGGSGTAPKDRRWSVGSSETSIDEFNDDSLDAAWVRVDGTGAASGNCTWVEGADVLSLKHEGGDTAAAVHGLVRPLSGLGGAPSVGDAYVTCLTLFGQVGVSYVMGGIILSDGTTHGSGNQVFGLFYSETGTSRQDSETRHHTNWTTAGGVSTTLYTTGMVRTFARLVKLASDTWRTDVSPDGVQWLTGLGTVTKVITPTHVGLLASSWGTSTKGVTSYEFLRKVTGIS